jgi:hypothetical protein
MIGLCLNIQGMATSPRYEYPVSEAVQVRLTHSSFISIHDTCCLPTYLIHIRIISVRLGTQSSTPVCVPRHSQRRHHNPPHLLCQYSLDRWLLIYSTTQSIPIYTLFTSKQIKRAFWRQLRIFRKHYCILHSVQSLSSWS